MAEKERWRCIGKRKRVATTPAMPGVWRAEGGGWWVRSRTTDPKTGKLREVSRFLEEGSAREAYDWLQGQLDAIRSGAAPAVESERIRFGEFAASLFEEKVKAGEIRSASGRVKWAGILEQHILPTFGDFYADTITNRDLQAWRRALAQKVHEGAFKPTTVNGWIAVMKVILKALAIDLELDRDPGSLLQPLPTVGHRTYTPESPNSLKPECVPMFLAKMRELHPGHHAMTMLGFLTGLRPSSLRPLRRSGPHADVLWETGELLVRRSQTYGTEVMESTKTGQDGRIALPGQMIEVLRQHAEELRPAQRKSELLFPNASGGFRSRGCLNKPFREVRAAIGIGYPVTPRAMRRTYQDLSRAAGVPDLVTRSISGHATEAMQHHYSTVADHEQRAALERVAAIMAGTTPQTLLAAGAQVTTGAGQHLETLPNDGEDSE
jgi:integrase